MRGAKPDVRIVRCHGMHNFGVPYAAACGWSGLIATATYILDERRCPTCGGSLRPANPKETP